MANMTLWPALSLGIGSKPLTVKEQIDYELGHFYSSEENHVLPKKKCPSNQKALTKCSLLKKKSYVVFFLLL